MTVILIFSRLSFLIRNRNVRLLWTAICEHYKDKLACLVSWELVFCTLLEMHNEADSLEMDFMWGSTGIAVEVVPKATDLLLWSPFSTHNKMGRNHDGGMRFAQFALQSASGMCGKRHKSCSNRI